MPIQIRAMAACAALAALAPAGCAPPASKPAAGNVAEYAIAWPDGGNPPRNACDPKPGEMVHAGSTHEIAFDPKRPGDLWISGQNYDWLARVTPATGAMRFVHMPAGSGPHGIEFDSAGRLWVSLECAGRLIALDADGRQTAEIRLPAGARPHGLAVGPDGRTIWYTGKTDGTIGRVAPDGTVTRFALKDPASTPIYVRAGPDGSMWATELTGNRIARVTPNGRLVEYDLLTPNSRPIAIVPGPDGAMWFSEEAGNEVGRIDAAGIFTTFVLPDRPEQPNLLLAGLAFDDKGDLWVQQYVDPNRPGPAGQDYLVRIDRAALKGPPRGFKPGQFERYPVATRNTVMHRVIRGPDGAMWFTEMHSDKVGRIKAE